MKISTFTIKNNNYKYKNFVYFMFIILLIITFVSLILTIGLYGYDKLNYLFWKQVLTILMGGTSIGISTYLFQQITNNKLADTSILGVGNINLIVAIFLTINFNVSDFEQAQNFLDNNSWTFMIFSTLIVLIIYFLSKQKNKFSSKKIVFIGIILNFCLITLYYCLINFVGANKTDYVSTYFNGGIFRLSKNQYIFGYISMFFCVMWCYIIKNKFFICCNNIELAKTLGININSIHFQILLIIGILTGIAFYSLGNIVLLGLLAASASTLVFKKKYNFSILGSGMFASLFLLMSFFVVNLLSDKYPKINGLEIYFFPLIGVPYFIYLALKKT